MRKEDEVVANNVNSVDKGVKVVEIPQKLICVPRPPPPFMQRLVKKTKNCKYWNFITMLKQLSINVPSVEELEKNA